MTLHRRTIASIALALLRLVPLPAQELDDSVELLLEGAFTVNITARIVDQDLNETVWNMDLTRITVAGKAVEVRLEGSNIVVEAEFTPYQNAEEELILIAEGRTWVSAATGDDVQYRTSFTSLPIRLGEPVLFLPLGESHVPVDTDRFGRLNIELEVNVDSYQS